jgi:hypothetical protein
MLKAVITIFSCCLLFKSTAQSLVTAKQTPGSFSLDNALIYVDENDFPVVKKSAALLQQDIEMVTGKKPALINKIPGSGGNIIIIGSLDRSAAIRELTRQHKINAPGIKNKWEAFIYKPLPLLSLD